MARSYSWRVSVRLAAPILLGGMRGWKPSNGGSLVAEVVVGDLAQDPQDRTDGDQKKDQAMSAAIQDRDDVLEVSRASA